MIVIHSKSAEQTQHVGEKLGGILSPGDVLGLVGELGTGKTTFIQGIARGLGVSPSQYVASPTFVIVNALRGRHVLHHVDLYRITSRDDLESIGFRDVLSGDAVVVIEWVDRLEDALGEPSLLIRLDHVNETTRTISFEQFTARLSAERLAEMFKEYITTKAQRTQRA